MSIVFMECSIEMYFQKERWPIERGKTYAKTSGRFCVSSENYYLPLRCRPARLTLSPSYPDPCQVWSYWVATAGRIPTRAPDWLPHRRRGSAVDSDSEWTSALRLNCWGCLDGSRSASTARLCQVGSTLPAWVESDTHWQAGPCHFRLRVKSAASLTRSSRRPRAACNPEDGLGCHWQCVSVHSPILLRPNPPSIALARIWVTWTWSTPGPHHWQWLGVTSQPMSVYVCIYICKPMYTYTYVHIPTNTYIYIHIHQYTRIYCFSYLDFLTPTLLLYIHIHTYTYIYIHILQYTYIIHTFTYIYIHILTRAWRKLTDDVTIMICKLEHMYGDTCTIPRSMHARKDACSLFYINTWAMIWPVDYQAKASWWMKIKITMIGVPV